MSLKQISVNYDERQDRLRVLELATLTAAQGPATEALALFLSRRRTKPAPASAVHAFRT